MGGKGSGNWYRWNKKTVIENCRDLDINRMIKLNAIIKEGWSSGRWLWSDPDTGERVACVGYEADTRNRADSFLRLHYTLTKQDKKIDYKVPLVRTKANYGGERFWFLCPVKQKRVSKLYLHPGGDIFASRHAYGLSYGCQSEDEGYRLIRKKHKLASRINNGRYSYSRPKGMHRKTYERLVEQAIKAETACDDYIHHRLQSIF
ncbi:MAG: hypothetical protein EA357_00875 [Micavibrio sp.]|nr:MAG: hypothetical protein EA357_00875 [Micavibrio sp.]